LRVKLVMEVSRGEDDRLVGTVRLAQATDAQEFSGTLELLRVFENLVPSESGAHVPRASKGRRGQPDSDPL
jgi:hypothetical protein